jgi:hypothetical protein
MRPYNGDPVTLYLDGESRRVPQIDAPAWRANGWGEDPETKTPVVEVPANEPPDGGEGGESTDTPAGDEGGETVEPPVDEPKPAKKGK